VDVSFANKKLQKLCESSQALQREHGQSCARKVMARLQDLESAESLVDMRTLPGSCHELTGDRPDHVAINVGGGKRLILRPASNPAPAKPDGGLDWAGITEIEVVGIQDYHS
jgi:proteic killer suppression protein